MFRGQAGTWDCDAWVRETDMDALRNAAPERPPRGQSCLRGKSTCVGPRGATYIIRGGIKIYTPRTWGKPSVPIKSAIRKSAKKVKKSAKRSVKKSAKRSVKKLAKRSVKKSAKRSVKKVKKSAKKSVRKSAKRSAKRSVRKTAKSRKAKKTTTITVTVTRRKGQHIYNPNLSAVKNNQIKNSRRRSQYVYNPNLSAVKNNQLKN